MSPAIRTNFEFERIAIALGGQTHDAYGEAVVLGDRRTWWIDSIAAEVDGVRLSWIKSGTPLFERLRLALHRQCGEQIAGRLNRAIEEQGGYEALFGEARPADPAERGRDRAPAFDDVYDVAA